VQPFPGLPRAFTTAEASGSRAGRLLAGGLSGWKAGVAAARHSGGHS
jgi:hypothetical protein